jgi:hypothetical protein
MPLPSLAAVFAEFIAGGFPVERREIAQRQFRRFLGEKIVDADVLER